MTEKKNATGQAVPSDFAGSLSDHWRRLAESWLAATDNMPSDDDCRVRALIRAEAFTDCANQLDEAQKLENRVDELEAVITETLNDNLHLTDGDVCTLLKLKRAVGWK